MSATDDDKILVVGAGPVGLAAAIELSRRGKKVRIIDQNDAPSIHSKALAVNARTLELMEPSGTTSLLLDQGQKLTVLRLHYGEKAFFKLDYSHMRHRYPFLLMLPQNKTEEVFVRKLQDMGVEVERNTAFLSLAQDEAQVTVETKGPAGVTKNSYAYVVAADGAHSPVRQALDLAFDGEAYPEEWHLADVNMRWNFGTRDANLFMMKGGKLLAVFPIRDKHFRLISNHKDPVTLLPKRSQVERVNWQSAFHISLRQVKEYGRGRVFLAGDSAHIHTPAGGRGMNLGIEDAASLAMRIAEGGLDGYTAARYEVGHRVVEESALPIRLMRLQNPLLRLMRDLVLRTVLSLPSVQARLCERLSGLSNRTL